MLSSLVLSLSIIGAASAAVLPKAKTLLAVHRQPDTDHLVKELHDNAKYTNASYKPTNAMTKDFVSMDLDGDKQLSAEELMFHQYATGCEPAEAQARGTDYMRCGDLDKNGMISLQEYEESAKPAWAECVKVSKDRRAHGFIRFFLADQNMDGNLTLKELTVGLIKLWGKPAEGLAADLMKCTDKGKDGGLNQTEFHSGISAYNPATRKWEMWNGTSDKEILKCMEPAMKKFDVALVFDATDKNNARHEAACGDAAAIGAVTLSYGPYMN